MNGAELGTPEFAYLLATVQANDVIGLDVPDLFPTTAKKQDKIFGQGRTDLEENGWIKPLNPDQNEYDLNSDLFEIVAMIASPDFVVATLREHPAESSGFTLHYITHLGVAELAPVAGDRFQLGAIADTSALATRMADLLGLKNARPAVEGSLPAATFKKVVAAAKKDQTEKAEELLGEAEGTVDKATSLVTAAGEPPTGHAILLPANGEAEDGKRVTVLGQGKSAWLVYQGDENSEDVVFVNGSKANIDAIVTEWTAESTD
jgi:hypothetical protein